MANLGTFERFLTEVGKALLPLQAALSSPESFFAFMLKLGWQADEIPQPLQDMGINLDVLYADLRKVIGDGLALDGSVSLESTSTSANLNVNDILNIKGAIERIINDIRDIATAPDAAIPARLRADDFRNVFPTQLINYLLINYLTTYQPQVAFAFRALGIVKTQYISPAGNRLSYVHYTFDFSDLPTVLSNPELVLENAFGWGTDEFDYRSFASQVDNLMSVSGIDVVIEEMDRDVVSKIDEDLELPGDPVRKAVKGVIFERARPSGRMAAEIGLFDLPKQGSLKPGFSLMPAFNGLLNFKMQLGTDIAVIIKSDLNLQGGVALLIRPGRPIEMVLGFNDTGASTHATGSIEVDVERSQLDNDPIIILGSQDGTRLQYRKIGGKTGVSLDTSNTVDVFAEFEIKGLEFVFDSSKADGFIGEIFPADGMGMGFDLAVGVSYLSGFYFKGTSNLDISIPTHIQLGPLDIQSMTIAAMPQADKLPIALGATIKAGLGPLAAVVENIGLKTVFSFPDQGGNLGPADLKMDFKPPDGVGLAIDSGVVKGGGYLRFFPDKEQYEGALELVFSGFLTLKAIGLITTRMPDGSKGFSLLIIITAEFGSPLQLGFGFTLIGVGGLLGLNRTMRLEVIAAGVRTGAVNSIIFPKDVIENAPRIISDLREFFPPAPDIFLIGPMAKLGWGSPTLVTISLGVIIEIPPGNIAILGVLKVVLPDEEAALIVLQVNFIGALEVDKKRLWFYAELYESRVVFITIDGAMGLLMAWGGQANFVLSVGGFHPAFSPPPLPFPNPQRVVAPILNEPLARVFVTGYFAVTSNTAQFGASVEVYFGLSEFRIQGHLGFDALFQFSPFYFIITISATLDVKVFGVGLFSVHFRGELEGTSPWYIEGEGSISVLFFSLDVPFSHTWGQDVDTTLPPIQVMPLLEAEFNKIDNWTAELPESDDLLVSLRKIEATEDLVLHPVGVLRVSQRAAPLDLVLDKVGNQKPNDVNKVVVEVPGADLQKHDDTREQFAIAQFKELNDSQKLSSPAFEQQNAGVALSVAGDQVTSAAAVKRVVRYEEIIIDSNFKEHLKRFVGFTATLFTHFLRGNAASKSVLSANYKRQKAPIDQKIALKSLVYVVASNSDNSAFSTDAHFTSQARANDYMQAQIRRNPNLAENLHVIPATEMEEVV